MDGWIHGFRLDPLPTAAARATALERA